MYIILKGQGVMTIDVKQQTVVEGDMILKRVKSDIKLY